MSCGLQSLLGTVGDWNPQLGESKNPPWTPPIFHENPVVLDTACLSSWLEHAWKNDTACLSFHVSCHHHATTSCHDFMLTISNPNPPFPRVGPWPTSISPGWMGFCPEKWLLTLFLQHLFCASGWKWFETIMVQWAKESWKILWYDLQSNIDIHVSFTIWHMHLLMPWHYWDKDEIRSVSPLKTPTFKKLSLADGQIPPSTMLGSCS